MARRAPDALAITGSGRVTYGALVRESRRLSARLRSLGVAPRARVAVVLERGAPLVAALLATLEAGAAYVPLDPSYPAPLLARMLEDARPAALLTDAPALAALDPGVRALLLALPRVVRVDGLADALEDTAPDDALPDEAARDGAAAVAVDADADAPAYVMFTSGSTGRPKGVEVPHRAVIRLVCDADYVALDARTVMLGFAPVAFDASTFEIWGALLNGGRIAMFPGALPTSEELGVFVVRERVDTLWLTAALFERFVERAPWALGGVRQLLAGGDVLSPRHTQLALDALPPGAVLVNGYGPTEGTTFTCCHRMPARSVAPVPVPIGVPIAGTHVRVGDPRGEALPPGAAGELWIGGAGLALGYIGQPALTAERFVTDARGDRWYRSGDVVRRRADGVVEFLGRADEQVKVRGYRIELAAVEDVLLGHAAVAHAAAVAAGDGADRELVAFVVPRTTGTFDERTLGSLRAHAAATLPAWMVPTRFIVAAELPTTPSGKVDRRALAVRATTTSATASSTTRVARGVERTVRDVFAEVLSLEPGTPCEHFFELGGTSLRAIRAAELLTDRLGVPVSPVLLFELPTVSALAARLATRAGDTAEAPRQVETRAPRTRSGDVAIVGMAGRFPGAPDVATLWRNLREGVESVTDFGRDGLDPLVPPSLRDDPAYVPVRGVVDDADRFDAAFFGIGPRLADVTDPQQRVFLEVAYEALEHAGCAPGRFGGDIGVFAGMGYNAYLPMHVATRPDLVATVGALPVQLANEKDYVATLVAHRLDLTGPAVSVHTACSTSLVAVCQAVQALVTGQCDAAIAGGVAITVPQRSGHLYAEGGMLSPDGRCRPFAADAQGTVFSDGAAAVVLKRLEDAVADGDHVWAVIRGAATNNDGARKASFTAPSVSGQAAVIRRALHIAGVDASTISYVEAHGTGTPLGDPIEVEALTRVYREATADRQFCGIGSVKGNVGHLTAAAGVTGLIKVALALHHRELPASINCTQPNPRLGLDESPFRVQATREAWPAGTTPRRAGVSSFGVGGTNAHVVLEEYVATEHAVGDAPALPRLLPISAKTPAALDAVAARLADHLDAGAMALDPVAWTLAVGREPYVERAFVVAADAADAARLLRAPAPARAGRARATASPAVAFLFPGQGAQHIGMARELHATDAGFRSIVDRCAELLRPLLGEDLRDALWPAGDREEAARRLVQTRLAQPALFVVQYALADLWMRWGVRPAALLGHSIGEFAAACHAGVFSLEDALTLVAHRGRLLQAQPEGAMLSVRAAPEVVEPLLPDDVSLAARNAPALCVVSGPHAAIAGLQATLEARDIQCRALHTSHAFHSAMVEPAMAPFEALVRAVRLSPPRLPVVSCVTGTWLTAEQATDPAYWARHLRATVRFADGLATLRAAADHVFLEVGPRQGATALARSVPSGTPVPRAVSSLPDGDGAERCTLLAAAGRLWTYGVSLDWAALHEPASRRRVPLPTYPFERHRHWVDQGDAPAGLALTDAGVAVARARATSAGRSDTPAATLPPLAVPATRDAAFLDDVIARQLALMQEQLALLQS